MTIDREKQYTELYFPEKMVDDKEAAYDALLDIDSNFSKFVQGLLKPIIIMSKVILSFGKNFRHFEWTVIIRDPKTKMVYSHWDKQKKWTKVNEDDV